MKKQLAAVAFAIFLPLLFVACVSSLLKEKAPTFSSEVKFLPPTEPFVVLNKSVFPSWKSRLTGNVLSILSDCQAGNPTSFHDLHHMIEDSVDSPQVASETTTTFQNKPALQRIIRAELDGSPLEIKSLAFKRVNCGYLVSLSGKPEHLKTDQGAFDSFLKSLTFK